jgi:predicted DNA-binding transcriptional regulator AlpA
MDRTYLIGPEVMSMKEVEWLLGISPMTLWLWRKQESFPHRAHPTLGGRHRLFCLANEVRDWVIEHRPERLQILLDRHQQWRRMRGLDPQAA